VGLPEGSGSGRWASTDQFAALLPIPPGAPAPPPISWRQCPAGLMAPPLHACAGSPLLIAALEQQPRAPAAPAAAAAAAAAAAPPLPPSLPAQPILAVAMHGSRDGRGAEGQHGGHGAGAPVGGAAGRPSPVCGWVLCVTHSCCPAHGAGHSGRQRSLRTRSRRSLAAPVAPPVLALQFPRTMHGIAGWATTC